MGHIQIRISDEEKKAAEKVLKKMGMNYSMAIKLFLRHVVKTKQLPFQIGVSSMASPFVNEVETNLWQESKDLKKNNEKKEVSIKKSVIPEIEPEIQSKKTWSPFQKHRIG
jgi:addiction module RelB/DinJ family antitoxin